MGHVVIIDYNANAVCRDNPSYQPYWMTAGWENIPKPQKPDIDSSFMRHRNETVT